MIDRNYIINTSNDETPRIPEEPQSRFITIRVAAENEDLFTYENDTQSSKEAPKSLADIPFEARTYDTCLEYVSLDVENIVHVPYRDDFSLIEFHRYLSICFKAMNKNAKLTLNLIPQEFRKKIYPQLLNYQTNCIALLSEDMQREYFNAVVSLNYKNHLCFVHLNDYEMLHKNFLAKISNVLVTSDETNDEIQYTANFLYFTNKNTESVVHVRNKSVTNDDIYDLLKSLSQYDNKIQLTLIDHTKFDNVCHLFPSHIAEIFAQFPNVSKVKLLACDSAKSKRFIEEHTDNAKYAFVTMNVIPDQKKRSAMLATLSVKGILCLSHVNDQYILSIFTTDEIETYSIAPEKLDILASLINPANKVLNFPSRKHLNHHNLCVGSVSGNKFLNKVNVDYLLDILIHNNSQRHFKEMSNGMHKSEPGITAFKTFKKFYFFMKNKTIEVKKEDKDNADILQLEPSFLLNTYQEICKVVKGSRNITVKGYQHKINVDLKNLRCLSSIHGIFNDDKFSLAKTFEENDNIDRQKQLASWLESDKKSKYSNDTKSQYKSITIKVIT